VLGVGDVVASVADAGADGAHAHAVDHLARVTMIPANAPTVASTCRWMTRRFWTFLKFRTVNF
jgi:hypothetical protein